MLRRWQFWLGLIISAVFLWLALRGLQLNEVLNALQGARYGWLIPGVAVYFVAVWARAWRWHYLLRPLKKITTRTIRHALVSCCEPMCCAVKRRSQFLLH